MLHQLSDRTLNRIFYVSTAIAILGWTLLYLWKH